MALGSEMIFMMITRTHNARDRLIHHCETADGVLRDARCGGMSTLGSDGNGVTSKRLIRLQTTPRLAITSPWVLAVPP